MKKLLSFMLVLAMLLTQFALPSFAYDEGGFGDIFGSEDEWVDPYEGLAVESVTVEAQNQLIENFDGYYDINEDGEEVFIYDLDYAELWFTVVYENGEEESCDQYGLSEYVAFFDDQYENPWDVGTHQVTGSYRETEFTVEVQVVESPVASFTAVAQKPIVDGWDIYEDYYFDENDNEVLYTGYNLYRAEPIFTITMKDGTVVTGTDEEIYEQTGYYTFDAVDQLENPLEIGKNTVKFVYMGAECECEIEIIPNPYESVTISGENEIVLEFNGVNEEDSYTTKIVDWQGMIVEGGAWGYITTDNGEEYLVDYYCYVDEEGNTYLNKDVSIEIGPFTTNTLEINNWLLAKVIAEDVLYYSMSYRVVSEDIAGHVFNGYNSADEEICIDDVVAISTYVCEMFPADEDEYYYYHNLDADTVNANIEAVFGLTDVDVTKSSFYSMFRIKLEEPVDNGINYIVKEFAFADGKWTLVADVNDGYTEELLGEMTVVLNEDMTVDQIAYTEIAIELGDVNGNGDITAVDARIILQYVAGLITEDEINMYCADVNEDGDVTAVDARMVLQKVAGLID